MMFGIPVLLLARIGTAIAIVAALAFLGHQVTDHWRDQGRVEIQAKWDSDTATRHKAENEAIAKRIAENAKQVLINEAKSKEVQREYERRIELQNRSNQRYIASLRAAGGLRFNLPKSFCSGFASQASTQSTGLDNETGTSRLPQQIEDGLFRFAEERDAEIIQLQSCQKWIRDSGLYEE
jgi:hypothetical protein